MRQLTIAILSLLILTGCEDNKTKEQIDADIASHITEFNYKGHRYLLYKRSYAKGGLGGITHDPDCPCQNNYVKLN